MRVECHPPVPPLSSLHHDIIIINNQSDLPNSKNYTPVRMYCRTDNSNPTHYLGRLMGGVYTLGRGMSSIAEMWNEMATKHGLAKIHALTPKRKQRIKACWEMMPDLDKWRIAIDEVPKDPFRRGENDRKWKANFDWFINTNTPFMTLLEAADIKTPDREQRTPSRLNTGVGYEKLEGGLDNDTSSKLLGDILKGIL